MTGIEYVHVVPEISDVDQVHELADWWCWCGPAFTAKGRVVTVTHFDSSKLGAL